jgi:hypothetical protein
MASTNIQSFSGDVTVTSNLTVDATTFHVDSVAGRIGIGKTDPAFAFDVGGIVNATSFYLGGSELQGGKWSSDASDIYYTTGAVGIGTNSPAKTLEVQGTLRLSNASTGGASDLFLTTTSTTWTQQAIIPNPDPSTSDSFGNAVGISGDGNTAIVGAYADDPDNVINAGSAYIFTRSGGSWSQLTTLLASDKAASDYFGQAVAISYDGNTVVVGAQGDDNVATDQGSAYIYMRSDTNWIQAKIVASDAAQTDYFGYSVGISGDGNTVIVGALLNDDTWSDSGSAYIFIRFGNSWTQQAKLVASDPAANDQFGNAVAISSDGNTVIVGAYADTVTYTNQGSAYIFTRSGSSWSEYKIQNPDPAQGDYFARSVAISGDGNTVIVGAESDDPGNVINAGSAYIFTRSGSSWSQQAQLVASDAAQYERFGYRVSLSGDGTTALVGAPFDNVPPADAGSAYIFTYSGDSWTQQQKLTASDLEYNARFGFSVAISANGTTALVGSPNKNVSGSAYAGSAYIFANPGNSLQVSTSITTEGTILSFTGQHMCFPDGPMGQGQIVSANKNKYITLNGPLTTGARAINSSESLPVVCLSNVANDKNVFGVVDRHEQGGTTRVQESGIGKVSQEKEWGDNRVIVNSIGEGAMWVTNTNGNLVSGNYITTSNIAGYGQKQHDNKLHSYTVAKITMDCDFEPEDLPVQVIKKDAEGNNVLDAYGRIQWEDTNRTEKAYRIRYLTTEGQRTDQANAVWTAAYVGCTYHCG